MGRRRKTREAACEGCIVEEKKTCFNGSCMPFGRRDSSDDDDQAGRYSGKQID